MKHLCLKLLAFAVIGLASACGAPKVKDTRDFASGRSSGNPNGETLGWLIDAPQDNYPLALFGEKVGFAPETVIDFQNDAQGRVKALLFKWAFDTQPCTLSYHFLYSIDETAGSLLKSARYTFAPDSKVREASIELDKLGMTSPDQILSGSEFWLIDCGKDTPIQSAGYKSLVTFHSKAAIATPSHELTYVKDQNKILLRGHISLALNHGYSCDFKGITFESKASGGVQPTGYFDLPSPFTADNRDLLEVDLAEVSSDRWRILPPEHVYESLKELRLQASCHQEDQRIVKVFEVSVPDMK